METRFAVAAYVARFIVTCASAASFAFGVLTVRAGADVAGFLFIWLAFLIMRGMWHH